MAETRRTDFATFIGHIGDETTGAAVQILGARGFAPSALSLVLPRGSDMLPAAALALRSAARGIPAR